MFIRPCFRRKNGKRHAYWALMESYRTARGPRQRVVAYLGQLDEPSRARSTSSPATGPATPTSGRSWSGSSGAPGWSHGASLSRIADRPGKPSWQRNTPFTWCAPGSATRRRWPPSTISRCGTKTLNGRRGATQIPTRSRRKIRRSNQRAILEHPGKKRRKPLEFKGLCQNVPRCAMTCTSV
jgi:hypothetical protein